MIQIIGIAGQKIVPDFAGYAVWHFEVGGDPMCKRVSLMEQVAHDLLVTNWGTQNIWRKVRISRDFSVSPFLGTAECMVIRIILCHSGMLQLSSWCAFICCFHLGVGNRFGCYCVQQHRLHGRELLRGHRHNQLKSVPFSEPCDRKTIIFPTNGLSIRPGIWNCLVIGVFYGPLLS